MPSHRWSQLVWIDNWKGSWKKENHFFREQLWLLMWILMPSLIPTCLDWQLFREQLWRVVMTVPRLLDQVPGQSPTRQLEETEPQVERPKCGPNEDWDERVTDAGDWKKVHHTYGSNNKLFTLSFYFKFFTSTFKFYFWFLILILNTLCRPTLAVPSYISPVFLLYQGNVCFETPCILYFHTRIWYLVYIFG